MINPGVVAVIHVVGVRGDPCGAVRWTNALHHKGHNCQFDLNAHQKGCQCV